MKKSAFLIMFVCLSLLVSAVSAETGLLTLKARDLATGRGTRNLAYESEDTRTYSLMDPQGNLLTSEAYTYMSMAVGVARGHRKREAAELVGAAV